MKCYDGNFHKPRPLNDLVKIYVKISNILFSVSKAYIYNREFDSTANVLTYVFSSCRKSRIAFSVFINIYEKLRPYSLFYIHMQTCKYLDIGVSKSEGFHPYPT